MKKNKNGEYFCTVCRKPIALTDEQASEIKKTAKNLAVNFFFVRYEDVGLHCQHCPPSDYKWKLKYRGIIPFGVKVK